jgi:DNA-binding NtrC family response regulator
MSSPAFANRLTHELIGDSPVIVALRDEIARAARTSAKVLILGETGVGKDIAARQLHLQSARAERPFVAVNCSGVPETLLESELFGHARGSFTGAYRDKAGLVRQAHSGTLFLDELGEMSLRMQGVLLRFTETGEVQPVGSDGPTFQANVRLITATNRDLRQQIAEGAFREDLFYRLNVIQIHIPPLRERGDDILLLMEYYLERAATAFGVHVPALSYEARQMLRAYAWPGNIRELRNVAERLALHDRQHSITCDELPVEVRGVTTTSTSTASAPLREGASDKAPAPAIPDLPPSMIAEEMWHRMMQGEDFWAVVHKAYKARELARHDLAMIIDRGLQETRGNYRALLQVFHLPASDYKRFHAFLYQQRCNLPVAAYRRRARGTFGGSTAVA